MGLQHDDQTGHEQNCGRSELRVHRLALNDISNGLRRVAIPPNSRPAFIKKDPFEHMYIRTRNTPRLLRTKAVISHGEIRWT